MSGWLKLHRSMLDWEWFDDHNTTRLFLVMLMRANHKQTRWRGVELEPGQLLSGRAQLAQWTGLSEQNVRSCLKRLISTNEVTSKSTRKYTIYSITNWDKYQDTNQQGNQQLTNNQPTTNHIQEVKNEKNEKKRDKEGGTKRFAPPSHSEALTYFFEQGSEKQEADKFMDYYSANGWMVGRGKMKDWKAAARNWIRRGIENGKHKANGGKLSAVDRSKARIAAKYGFSVN